MDASASPPAADPKGRSALAFVATRPVAITMFMLALGVFGVVSLNKLPVDLLPEISYPTLTVRTAYEGAAPEDVEDRVSVRLQEALSTLAGLVSTTSISRAGFSDIVLEFDWGTNMTFAVQEVRDRLDGVFMPDGAERPLILRYDPNLDPILRIGVSPAGSDAGEDAFIHLRWICEKKIKRELEGVEGVAAIQVRGGLEEEIRVQVDPYKLSAQNLDPSEVARRLRQENLNASGGQIREGSTDYLVRTLNEFQSLEDIENLAIVRRGDTAIRLRDIAIVTRTHAEREVITRLNGAEAVEIAIYREAGANIVDVARRVRNAVFGNEEQQQFAREKLAAGEIGRGMSWEDRRKLAFLGWYLRDEAKLEMLSDQSTFIAAAIADVKESAILGALLAIAVIWVFLRHLSATLIIALAIPISVIVTFAPMYLLDVSLNIMSLGGLALGVGMLVDNAIVVLESITRCREEGDDLAQAAVRGVGEVAGAITASTLTTVAVFVPIVFVYGIAGQIFGDQAVTVVSSLLVSLLVAVLFIPMLASRTWLAGDGARLGLRPGATPEQPGIQGFLTEFLLKGLTWSWMALPSNLLLLLGRALLLTVFLALRLLMLLAGAAFFVGRVLTWPLRRTFDWIWNTLDAVYPRALALALRHPLFVLLLAGLLSWGAMRRLPNLGLELLPEIHQGEFTAHVGLAVGTPLEHSDIVFSKIDREIRAYDEVAVTALTIGVEQDTLSRRIEGEHTARITVRLRPEFADSETEERVLERVRALLRSNAEVRTVDVTRPTPFALESPIAVEVHGFDLERMGVVAETIRARLEQLGGLTDVRTTVRAGHPEARVTFDRDKMLQYGLDLATVSNLVRDQILGTVATRFVDGEDRIDIRVMADERILATLEDVLDLIVNPASEQSVPLRSIAEIEVVRGPAEIRRIGNSRAIVITATSTGLDLGGVTKRIESTLASLVTPDDIDVGLGGQKREMEEGMKSLRFALLLAIFLVYVVMASQFESLLQPLIILFSVPLAGVGVVLVLDALDIPLSVVVFIGLILLAGIVVNNAIVLVDRINQKCRAGLETTAALLEAGRARLRPILMTTATTVLGLLPLTGWLAGLPFVGTLGAGEGAELRAPMAITVIAGLLSSTLLTLIVIPVIYKVMGARPLGRTDTSGRDLAVEGAGPQ
ncbi:MAG: efflux RND transporter permease subunit [Planctomycetota bacterium]|nr:MAG: efflux RND transporter permease subunit [Planctomycetota bacterium]